MPMCLSNWFLNVAYVFHKERAAYVVPILITCSHFTSRPRPGSQSKQEETVVLLGLNINLHDILLGYFPQHTRLLCNLFVCLSQNLYVHFPTSRSFGLFVGLGAQIAVSLVAYLLAFVHSLACLHTCPRDQVPLP